MDIAELVAALTRKDPVVVARAEASGLIDPRPDHDAMVRLADGLARAADDGATYILAGEHLRAAAVAVRFWATEGGA